jgi:hypothetical protein
LHENGQFLYKSHYASSLRTSRNIDYLSVLSLGGFLMTNSTYFFLPMCYTLFFLPKSVAVMHYFTYHAELLPHTEQVVFQKANFFGKSRTSVVDIKNLEKIDASEVV